MCKPVKDYLSVLREYTREVITFGGFILCIFVYHDFRELAEKMAESTAQNNEILRAMDSRLKELEHWHALERAEKRGCQ